FSVRSMASVQRRSVLAGRTGCNTRMLERPETPHAHALDLAFDPLPKARLFLVNHNDARQLSERSHPPGQPFTVQRLGVMAIRTERVDRDLPFADARSTWFMYSRSSTSHDKWRKASRRELPNHTGTAQVQGLLRP